MQKLLLILGIPLVFIAGIAAFETGQLLWIGLVVPLAVARYFMRRTLKEKDEFVLPQRDRPDQIDTGNVASHSPSPDEQTP